MPVNPKVIAGGVAGSATLVLVWVAGLFNLEVPVEVGVAVSVLLSAGAGWLKRG